MSIKDKTILSRLKEGSSLITQFSDTLSSISLDDSFSKTIEVISYCKGKIVTTGMGKAGIAMRKFSSTLCSLGFPSCYLHPGEASHGDLGLLDSDDVLFVASTSGKTREVLETINLARKMAVQVIVGITSHTDSPIRDKANIVLNMGIIKEAGHLGLAPTSSILVMLALTDALALVAAKEAGLTKKQYGVCHHSGYLGQVAREQR